MTAMINNVSVEIESAICAVSIRYCVIYHMLSDASLTTSEQNGLISHVAIFI